MVREALEVRQISIRQLVQVSPTLEDAFIAMISGLEGFELMDLGRTWAIARKEFIHIRRDPHSLIMIILLPVIQLLIYGYALTFNIKDVPVAVYNRDQVHLADRLNTFRGSPYFKLTRSVGSSEEIDRLLAARQVRLGSGCVLRTMRWHVVHAII